jgi:hypothetical protein
MPANRLNPDAPLAERPRIEEEVPLADMSAIGGVQLMLRLGGHCRASASNWSP